ncbi:DUF6941 family protein [Novosphingobium pentaromativorans]|uniref:DUF6941 family protein n=1 Tax=Novosphingobium pentaromativorans TaxID=205844 RepID=UPI00051F77FD|nr:hypothetical protein [Novosphingobium pentaromativorans]AIT79115.1 hypothetical protein JI59_04490 [Novosphingobium pentaromativorans US6-1]
MIIHPTTPGGYAIFCDDIRDEINGKTTLVGTYNGEMFLQASLPATIPQLCCFATIIIDPHALPKQVSFEIQKHLSSDKVETIVQIGVPPIEEMPEPEYRPGFGDEKKIFGMKFSVRMPLLSIDRDMTLRAVAIVDENQHRIGSLTVRQVEKLPAT